MTTKGKEPLSISGTEEKYSLNPALKIHSGVEEVKDEGKEEYREENGKKKVFTMAG